MAQSSKDEKDLLSEIIRLSVSSYGETPEDCDARRLKLIELGAGHDLFGYDVSDMDGTSDYILTTDDLIEKTPGCCGHCVGVIPNMDELSFMVTVRKTGSSLIHVHTAELPVVYTSGGNELHASNRTCVKIVINAETKGVVRLDFPPHSEGTHGDITLELIPVAVIGQDEELAFIFRPSTLEKNEDVTEILTADGTGFVVAKVGPVESILWESGYENSKRTSIGKVKKDHFCVLFLDRLMGRSWKQLLFSVATVFFYQWLINKAYKKSKLARRKKEENVTERKRNCNCTVC